MKNRVSLFFWRSVYVILTLITSPLQAHTNVLRIIMCCYTRGVNTVRMMRCKKQVFPKVQATTPWSEEMAATSLLDTWPQELEWYSYDGPLAFYGFVGFVGVITVLLGYLALSAKVRTRKVAAARQRAREAIQRYEQQAVAERFQKLVLKMINGMEEETRGRPRSQEEREWMEGAWALADGSGDERTWPVLRDWFVEQIEKSTAYYNQRAAENLQEIDAFWEQCKLSLKLMPGIIESVESRLDRDESNPDLDPKLERFDSLKVSLQQAVADVHDAQQVSEGIRQVELKLCEAAREEKKLKLRANSLKQEIKDTRRGLVDKLARTNVELATVEAELEQERRRGP